jgi:hypothetical protein
MVDFLNTGDTIKGIVTSVNKGIVNSGLDGNVEPLQIEAIHTKFNGNPLIIMIEPADLDIQDNVRIGMAPGRVGYGRMDPIANYTNTSRSIEIAFKMIKSEVLNGKKAVTNNTITANLLKQMLYPSYIDTGYQNTSVIKTAPYFKIKYGDLIGNFDGDSLSGFFSSVNISNSAGGNIGANLAQGDMSIIPIEYSVRMTFNVLHDHVVGWYEDQFAGEGRMNWPFNVGIAPSNPTVGPGGIGGNNVSTETTPVPGSPATTSAEVAKKLK